MDAAEMRRICVSLAIAVLMLATIAGCRPSGPSEDFGTVESEIPKVPGADKPYVIPGIAPPSASEKKSQKAKAALLTPPVKVEKPKAEEKSQPETTPKD